MPAAPEPLPRYLCLPFAGGDAEPPGDSRVLHFFRHGEALHQVRNAEAERRGKGCRCFDPEPRTAGYVCPYWSDDLIDAPLTRRGREEIVGRGAPLGAELILSSPMTRTLETSVLAFPETIPVLALPELRPRIGAHRHSRLSSRGALVRRFPRVDLSRLTDEEDGDWSLETEPREALEHRAARFLDVASSRCERRIAVVTHFTVLLALLLPPDDTFTLGPSRRPTGSHALLDCSACPDPEVLREPVGVGESRSLVISRARG